jgi:ABC-type sugar transport system permease subunit
MVLVIGGWFAIVALKARASRDHTVGRMLGEMRAGWHGYVFVLPGLVAIFAFAIYPSLYQFYLAFHKGDGLGVMQYVGWENFRRILDFTSDDFDVDFWTKVVPNTLIYMGGTVFAQITVGLFFASLLNLPLKANRVYRVLFFVPLVTSLAIVSVIMIGLLRGPGSGLNEVLDWVGLGNLPYWLGLVEEPGKAYDWLGPQTGLWLVMAVGAWHGLPARIILLLAGLQSIEPQLYEAAKVDGASAWQRFWHVTIPEILPILVVIAFMALVQAARAFSVVFVLTRGGPGDRSSELVATYIFKWGFMKPEGQEANLGYASALGIVYSLMLAALTFTNVMIVARRWKRRLASEERGGPPATQGDPR